MESREDGIKQWALRNYESSFDIHSERTRVGSRIARDFDRDDVILRSFDRMIIGSHDAIETPFGTTRRITYCDWTASGKAVEHIERFIADQVLPVYGNTHTFSSYCGLQTSMFREEARIVVVNSLFCSQSDEVIFSGSGSTSAINHLIHILKPQIEAVDKVVVFLGPFEHHSNMLPWREIHGAEIVTIKEDFSERNDGVDLEDLRMRLEEYKWSDNVLKIGSFSAGSNISGILTNVDAVTELLHDFGFLAFWDYSAVAPYRKIMMNPDADEPEQRKRLEKDAIFFSPHKMLGGVGTTGILVVKKILLARAIEAGNRPFIPGGGTVFFVGSKDHHYLDNFREREEGGTPNIVGCIRTGLTLQLRDKIGIDFIERRTVELSDVLFSRLKRIPKIIVLGNENQPHRKRLPIASFLIRHGNLFLHYNFVCILLNDLFGIQSRGGCACAGVYAQCLLGIDSKLSKTIENQMYQRSEILRPGFTRINLCYTMYEYEVKYILDAVEFIALHGWKFLPLYVFDITNSEWRHRAWTSMLKNRRWLSDIVMQENSEFSYLSKRIVLENLSDHFDSNFNWVWDYLGEHIEKRNEPLLKAPCVDDRESVDSAVNNLRWFLLPYEAFTFLFEESITLPKPPFHPDSMAQLETLVEEKSASENDLDQKETHGKHEENELQHVSSNQEALCQYCFHHHKREEDGRFSECIACNCLDYRSAIPSTKKIKAKLEKTLLRQIGEAIREYSMINEGDRVLVALSGGKDSLTLLSMLLILQKRAPIQFDIGACTIDPQYPEYNPQTLKKYLAKLNVPYFYEEAPILEMARKHMDPKKISMCSFCARMKRGNIYSAARRENYNVIAMGQHLDDLAESFLMSCFHNGLLRTMKANYICENGDLRVIRPLIYVRERSTRQYAKIANLPVINENCPACFASPKERQRIKELLIAQERVHSNLFNSLLTAMKPLMSDGTRDEDLEEDESPQTCQMTI